MNKNYSEKFVNKLKNHLLSTSNRTAKNVLLKRGYSSSAFTMPAYYSPTGLNAIKLSPIVWPRKNQKNWAQKDRPVPTNTLDVLTPKNGLSWRSFNFLHPYIYVHIVNELTKNINWKKIKTLLTLDSLVYCYSIPILTLKKGETLAAAEFKNWQQMAEKDLIKDCTEYSHLVVTDIKNFYPTIYTHAIAWAVQGKATAKAQRTNDLFGNRLDTLFRCSRDGQTNGIPVGSMVSDLIAEVLLADVDQKLSKAIKNEKNLSSLILIMRYRDDYKILSKSIDAGKKVLSLLNMILQTEYNLHLNSDKTETFDDIIEGAFRPWTLEIKDSHLLRRIYYNDFSEVNSNYLKDCFLETYRVQKKYPNGRVSISVLTKIATGLFSQKIDLDISLDEILVFVSLLRKLTLLREEATPQIYTILDLLLAKMKSDVDKRRVLSAIRAAISGKSDTEYQLIWFYRLCLSSMPKMCNKLLKDNNFPLLRILERQYYPRDIDLFEPIKISALDQKQLQQFTFINRKMLKKTTKNPIEPRSVNIFKYGE